MKLCSRLLVLYCRNLYERQQIYVFDPHFEEVRGGVEPWLMLVGKPVYDFLFAIIELFSLALTANALKGKTCQDSLLSGGGRSVRAKISGEGVVPGEYFLVSTKLHILLSDSANCTVLCAIVLTQYRRVTDGRTDRRNCHI